MGGLSCVGTENQIFGVFWTRKQDDEHLPSLHQRESDI